MQYTHIYLVGMAGCGKSTLGRRLAESLKMPFVDTDQRICEIFGLSMHELFSKFGDQFIRNCEAGVLMELIGNPSTIVSTGGSLPTIKENVLLMQNHGIIIHIDRPIDQILSDIKTDRRPELKDATSEEILQQYSKLIGHYKACADYTLDNSKGALNGQNQLLKLLHDLKLI